MKQWWQRFAQHRVVAHLLRAIDRFNVRGGGQFAAAIAYFSVLSIVPILMLAFSALGLTLTVVRPDALTDVQEWVTRALSSYGDLGEKLVAVITAALRNWATLGLTGLAIAFWSGATWMGNLKRAVQALLREDYDRPPKQRPLPLEVLVNFGGLLLLFIAVLVSASATVSATALAREVGQWLGVSGPGWSVVVRLVALALSLAIGVLLFWWMFRWFALAPLPGKLLWIGAGVGAIGLVALQALASLLIGLFSRNLAASLFGSVIILMMFFNLLATLILYVAAWLATTTAPADVQPEPEPASVAPPPAPRPGEEQVSAAVARRSMGVGLATGYTIGTATGLGVGAVLVSVLSRLFGKRPRR
jgi:membrane protein